MKTAEAEILLIPGFGDSSPGHWMRRWADKISTARVVEQDNWWTPSKKVWMETLLAEIERATKPVVLVAHSLGCILVAHGAHVLPKDKVRGAFLVAPSDWDRPGLVPEFDGGDFVPVPRMPLPFRTHVVASRNDDYCDYAVAHDLATAWGATLQDAGQAGHINLESGHGPWPEGMMSFAHFMARL